MASAAAFLSGERPRPTQQHDLDQFGGRSERRAGTPRTSGFMDSALYTMSASVGSLPPGWVRGASVIAAAGGQGVGSQPPIGPDAPDLPKQFRAVPGDRRLVDHLTRTRTVRAVPSGGHRFLQCRTSVGDVPGVRDDQGRVGGGGPDSMRDPRNRHLRGRNRERLRGVRMPWTDVLNAAGVLAAAAGIEIVE